MTAESLIYYLQNPQQLYDISYQEIENLVAQYPYCQNLRYLLVQKSKIEERKEYPKHLQLAATYSINRSLLHHQLFRNPIQISVTDNSVGINEDYLELKELDKLEEDLEANFELEEEATLMAETNDTIINSVEPSPFDNKVEPEKEIVFEVETPIIEEDILPEAQSTPDTLIDRILNEFLPEDKVQLETSEDKIITFEDFIEEENEKTSKEELGEKASDSPNEEPLTDRPFEEEIIEENAISDWAIEPNTQPIEEQLELENNELILEKEEEELIELIENQETKDILVEFESEEIEEIREEEIPLFIKENTDKGTQEELENTPKSKLSFNSWLDFYNTNEDKTLVTEFNTPIPIPEKNTPDRNKQIKKLLKVNKKKKKKKQRKKEKSKKEVSQELASKSILESEEIISQTLADLLAAQGYSEKAIKMYERLSLIFPEKSAFFAQKIKELNYFED